MVRIIKFTAGLLLLSALIVAGLIYNLHPPTLPVPENTNHLISDITLVNPGEPARVNQTLEVHDGRSVSIRDHRADDPPPLCPGCYLMPGLVDAHVHTPPSVLPGQQALFALLYLEHGVTSIRDLGAADDSVADFARRLNDRALPGPTMYRCGPVLEGSPPAWPVARIINTEEEAVETVTELVADGVDCIKVYNEVALAPFKVIVETAAAHNIPVIGHVPHKVGLRNVRNFEAQHFTGVPYLNHPRPRIGWDIATEDILARTDEEVKEALTIAKARNIAFTPTLANFYLRLSASDPTRFVPPQDMALLPSYWREAFPLVAGHPDTEEQIANQIKVLPVMRHWVKLAYEEGIDIMAGTDTLMPFVIPGDGMHRELEQLSQALSTETALKLATITNGSRIDGQNIGRIDIGKRADFLLLPHNPTNDLKALQEWTHMFVAGRHYTHEQVSGWIDLYLDHFESPLNQSIMSGLVGFISRQYQSAQASED